MLSVVGVAQGIVSLVHRIASSLKNKQLSETYKTKLNFFFTVETVDVHNKFEFIDAIALTQISVLLSE